MTKIITIERTVGLMKHLEERFTVHSQIDAVIDEAKEYIKKEVIGTGKSFALHLVNDSELSNAEFQAGLSEAIHREELLNVSTLCPSVLKIQCMKKIRRINNLNKIQRYMYELRDFNPELIELGFEKLTHSQQTEIRKVLLFEK